ncbi:MAG: TSUP family transporter, partial [Pseudomonadota bacterium]
MTLLPPGMDAWLFAALAAASFATSAMTAAFGLGGGAALLALLASLMPPAALIPVHGVVQLASNAGRAAVMRREARLDLLGPFAFGALAGAGLGASLAVSLPPWAVQLGVGAFILWTVWGRAPAPPAGRVQAFAGAAAGVVTTFLTMFFGATGPFVAAWLKTLGLGRETHVATNACAMTLQHGLKSVAFGLFGFAFAPWLGLIAAMAAAGFLGTLVGRRALRRMTDARFAQGLDLILTALALRLIAQAAGL